MTGPSGGERPDGDAMDPAIARVLLRYREIVAEATADALGGLRILGFDRHEAAAILTGPPDETRRRYRSTTPA